MTLGRERLALALDVGGLPEALVLAERLHPWFATAKVGVELYAEAGPEAFDRLHELEFEVFADLKLHDIPNTVERAARALGRRGVEFLNFHAAGGVEMLRGAVNGYREGAEAGGHRAPVALGVTVLTSDANTDALVERLDWSRDAGCDGVVCAASDIAAARARALRTMVPGVRLPGDDAHDQARITTPADAIKQGADWLVVGRAVTAAVDPERAAADVCAMVKAAATT